MEFNEGDKIFEVDLLNGKMIETLFSNEKYKKFVCKYDFGNCINGKDMYRYGLLESCVFITRSLDDIVNGITVAVQNYNYPDKTIHSKPQVGDNLYICEITDILSNYPASEFQYSQGYFHKYPSKIKTLNFSDTEFEVKYPTYFIGSQSGIGSFVVKKGDQFRAFRDYGDKRISEVQLSKDLAVYAATEMINNKLDRLKEIQSIQDSWF